MGVTLEPWPTWAEQALQGLAYWIGHRHALYRHYPLAEGALVAETCNLIHAHLKGSELLLCEERYKRLVPAGNLPAGLGSKSRADLVVVENLTAEQVRKASTLAGAATAVVEVKRYSAPTSQIDYDLQRLAMLKAVTPSVRALLFVVSEANVRSDSFLLKVERFLARWTSLGPLPSLGFAARARHQQHLVAKRPPITPALSKCSIRDEPKCQKAGGTSHAS